MMDQIGELLGSLRRAWGTAKYATHSGTVTPAPLICSFEAPSEARDIEIVSTEFLVPGDLIGFWKFCGGARLFEDAKYSQWGLHLLSPAAALVATQKFAHERESDHAFGDLVIGEFVGDSDLLILRCDPSLDSYGAVLVALPLDDRADWDHAAGSLTSFVEKYVEAQGDKFWQRRKGTSE
jgi:hypothetical protein